ncbi:MAG TPA: hypothetical protein VGP26_25455 [Actinophytocola sp.]|nr:hypothetical protein [Actinophytocola sp.]
MSDQGGVGSPFNLQSIDSRYLYEANLETRSNMNPAAVNFLAERVGVIQITQPPGNVVPIEYDTATVTFTSSLSVDLCGW